MLQIAWEVSHQTLCRQAVVTDISFARASVAQYLQNKFAEIKHLQESPKFLENIEAIQREAQAVEIWQVQREQLSAVEECAKACTCGEGAILVVQEYNRLAKQLAVTPGLALIPLPTQVPAAAFIILPVIGFILWAQWRRKRT